MNCKEAIEYIHSLEKFGIKPGLERIGELCDKLGNPQNKLRFVHIAGTNGKGSTSTMVANILTASGYNTGLYTSPYVIEFRERIQRNGSMIEPEELAYCVDRVKSVSEEYNIDATEFEAITAAAFLYFYRSGCDYVVLEVGLGGRFDATNIILHPEVAVIACISRDHTAVLGDTIKQIAGEKCGIIKEKCSVVTYPLQVPDAAGVIENKCRETSSVLTIPDISELKITESAITGTSVSYKDLSYLLRLPGEHMVYNSLTAIEAVRSMNINITDDAVKEGIEKTVMPARMEIISDNPLIIMDGGHNEDCGRALRNHLLKYLPGKKILMVSSMMADKDFKTYLELNAPLVSLFIATRADVPRALSEDKLMEAASEYCSNCIKVGNSVDAVKKALLLAPDYDAVIICGSFYLAGEVRDFLLNRRGE